MTDSPTPASGVHTARLTFVEKLGYGLGDTASNLFFQFFNFFLLYYYTDVYGLSPAAVGTMFLVTRIFDAVTDPLMGAISDRTRTRWGRFRPYLLWFSIPFGLTGFLMFVSPDFSPTGKLVWAYATYSVFMLIYTIINVPYSAMLGVISPSSEERTKAASVKFMCAFGGGFLISLVVVPLKEWLGGEDELLGFQRTMALFALLSVILFMYTFFATKERIQPEKEEHGNLWKDLSLLFRCRPWLIISLGNLMNLGGAAIRGGVILFYFKYLVEDERYSSWLMVSGTVCMIAGQPIANQVQKFLGKRQAMIFLFVFSGLFVSAIHFVPARLVWPVFLLNILGTLVVAPTAAISWSMYGDCADWVEWKHGRRITGLVYSSILFGVKAGLAIGGAGLGWMLAGFGFEADAVQTDTSLLGISLLMSIIPGLLMVATGLAMIGYNILDEDIPVMEAELKARHAKP